MGRVRGWGGGETHIKGPIWLQVKASWLWLSTGSIGPTVSFRFLGSGRHLPGQEQNLVVCVATASKQPLLIPPGSSCDQSDPNFGRLLLVDLISHSVASTSFSLLVRMNPVSPSLLNSSGGLKVKESFPSSHFLQGFCTADSPS